MRIHLLLFAFFSAVCSLDINDHSVVHLHVPIVSRELNSKESKLQNVNVKAERCFVPKRNFAHNQMMHALSDGKGVGSENNHFILRVKKSAIGRGISVLDRLRSYATTRRHDVHVLGSGTFSLNESFNTMFSILSNELYVALVCTMQPHHKVSPTLSAMSGVNSTTQLLVAFWPHPDASPQRLTGTTTLPSLPPPARWVLQTATTDFAHVECHSTALCVSTAEALSRSSCVSWIEPVVPHKIQNKYVRGIIQSGVVAHEPFSAAGLTGEGEVVGVSDTGIDADHCFFHDPDHKTPYFNYNKDHRKIVRYDALDASQESHQDVNEGHGTHVCGSLAGSPYVKDAAHKYQYRGMVPDAKIAFFDLAKSGDTVETISLPSDLRSQVLPYAYSTGARVHTNSWGGAYSAYTSYSHSVDLFMHNHNDMLIVFAAGNDADRHCERNPSSVRCDKYTVMSPSTNKNGLSVGSSMAPLVSWEEMGEGNYELIAFSGKIQVRVRAMKAGFGPKDPVLPFTDFVFMYS
eukprot:PhM_4_TR14669/c0_g1_i3/m.35547